MSGRIHTKGPVITFLKMQTVLKRPCMSPTLLTLPIWGLEQIPLGNAQFLFDVKRYECVTLQLIRRSNGDWTPSKRKRLRVALAIAAAQVLLKSYRTFVLYI